MSKRHLFSLKERVVTKLISEVWYIRLNYHPMKLIKRLLFVLLLLVVIFASILTYNYLNFKSRQITVAPIEKIDINDTAIDRFSKALKIKTVSPENPADFDSLEFRKFNDFIVSNYPLMDSLLDKKIVNDFSHLYYWKGSDVARKPIILMGHLDVVPVIEKNLPEWKVGPFDGKILNDTIWGRGAIDDKVGVITLMEAVEHLLGQGYQPETGIYLAFGHDEEIGGPNGAVAMAAYLKEQGVEAEFVMDEGGVIAEGLVPGINKEVALIGTAEKGFLSLGFSVKIEGGHSSMPGDETAIDVLAEAVSKVKKNPLPTKLTVPLQGFMDYLGPEMPFANRLAFANREILKPVILSIFEKTPSSSALVRTTTAPTIFNSGVKDNIIPQNANAVINFRILPETSIEDVLAHCKEVIDDDRVKIEKINTYNEASNLSSTEAFGFKVLNKTVKELFPDVLTSPNLVVGATDSRHYKLLSPNIYRFSPIHLNENTKKSFHGLNERLSLSDFKNGIRFYINLIRNSNLDPNSDMDLN